MFSRFRRATAVYRALQALELAGQPAPTIAELKLLTSYVVGKAPLAHLQRLSAPHPRRRPQADALLPATYPALSPLT